MNFLILIFIIFGVCKTQPHELYRATHPIYTNHWHKFTFEPRTITDGIELSSDMLTIKRKKDGNQIFAQSIYSLKLVSGLEIYYYRFKVQKDNLGAVGYFDFGWARNMKKVLKQTDFANRLNDEADQFRSTTKDPFTYEDKIDKSKFYFIQ